MKVLVLAVLAVGAAARAAPSSSAEPDPALAVAVEVDGKTFVNKGLVGFGLIPSNFRESTGDTLGGIGSAIALKPGTFHANKDGSFSGTLITQPDRGFNLVTTINYQGRQHEIDFVLQPYYGTANLSFNASQASLALTYKKTLLYKDRRGVKTSGLDSLGVRPAELGFPLLAIADPVMPIPNVTFNHLTMDNEGLVVNDDGSFWVSDEYGPYIYRFDSGGNLVQTIQPPLAILPQIAGKTNFTSVSGPDTGRVGNQGFECLTLDKSTNTLWAMLQSATVQDGGDDKSTSRFTRLLAYDVAAPLLVRPPLLHEFVVPLPLNKKGNTLASSEIHFVSEGVLLALSRDGNGHGDDNPTSQYKQIDLISLDDATDIHGTEFDSAQHPIAVNGTLDSSIKPATYTSFLNMLNTTQLARFGLHNGDPVDQTLIDGKWESIALAPVGDPKFPHDFFVFTAADNDFITTDGFSLGIPYNAGLDNDNQFMVWRVTLPTAVGTP
ncbi:phytase-like domain-containing protein [Phanerochaete sordida]|uniref:Phytase-like domain-containing protein n=1 Tax=Phanerochaete sordida TaxID=48140 RepID=A0A9P3GCG2_9APHY|nr:phytase-like domain-containing protein [Phanerochaete sordida]